jgi:hypothetical protein
MITYTGYKQYPQPTFNDSVHPLLPNAPAGLPFETIMKLSPKARHLYDTIYDYCTYSSDPQYQTLHTFRVRIARIENTVERDILIAYFNNDPAIQWNGMTEAPYEYYAKPY